MNTIRARLLDRPQTLASGALLAVSLVVSPAVAQFGAIGLSGVGGQRFGNEDLLFFVPEASDQFGAALATGDFDGDGFDDLATGILVATDGMVTVVMGSPSGVSNARRHGLALGRDGNPGVANQPSRHFGSAVAAGDFDGDGFADLAIGAPFEDESGLANVGAEVVFYGSLFANGFDNGDPGYWSGVTP